MNTKQLKENHVINTMVREHEHILDMLEKLEKISFKLSNCDQNSAMKFMDRVNELSIKIIGAEPHHKREEEVLFPAMAENGYSGPAECMKREHEIMRKIKQDLKDETEKSEESCCCNWKNKKDKVSQLISELCRTLRAHIDKENNILYPMALQSITEDIKWEEMKIKCDEIGYCCFCPTINELDKTIENN
jgi:hypothetical protein